MKRAPAIVFSLFICLFWNGIVGVFDVMILRGVVQTYVARSKFEVVDARVTSSTVASNHDGDGTTYKPAVSYEYDWGGRTYVSDRVAYGVMGTSDGDYAEAMVAAYPAGAKVEALVDPNEPSEAVLDVSGSQVPSGVILFLTPFHCVGAFLLWMLFQSFRKRDESEEAAARKRFVPIDNDRHLVIAKPVAPPVTVFLVALGGSAFLATFPVVFIFGFHGPQRIVLSILGACIALATVLAFRQRAKKRAPENYVHIDKRLGVFSYPADAEGAKLEDVVSITKRSRKTNVTINDEPQFDHEFEVETKGGLVSLFEMRSDREDGERMERILESELGGAPG